MVQAFIKRNIKKGRDFWLKKTLIEEIDCLEHAPFSLTPIFNSLFFVLVNLYDHISLVILSGRIHTDLKFNSRSI